MAGQFGDYAVDLVMCIDATRSMSPIIDEVKRNALTFHEKFVEAMSENNKDVEVLRLKVIVFRDYICDTDAMVESEFFTLPDDNIAFRDFVNRIEASGGGDTPENALEALALAIKSKWTKEGEKRRHAILLFTDAAALELGARKDCARYPTNLPKTFAELSALWENGSRSEAPTYQPNSGRLVVFAPDAEPWNQMQAWNRVWMTVSAAGAGLSEVEMASAIDILVASVAATPMQ